MEEQSGDARSLLAFYRALLRLRREYPALQGNEWAITRLETSGAGPWAFMRRGDDRAVTAVFNFASEARTVIIAAGDIPGLFLIDLLTHRRFEALAGEGLILELPPASVFYLAASQGN